MACLVQLRARRVINFTDASALPNILIQKPGAEDSSYAKVLARF